MKFRLYSHSNNVEYYLRVKQWLKERNKDKTMARFTSHHSYGSKNAREPQPWDCLLHKVEDITVLDKPMTVSSVVRPTVLMPIDPEKVINEMREALKVLTLSRK